MTGLENKYNAQPYLEREKMESLKNIKVGDIFYTQVGKWYYFFQIIHITDDLPPPYDVSHKFGYFIIVFEKRYEELPKTIDEMDLVNIYNAKYTRKGTVLYISHWDKVPEIKVRPNRIDSDRYSEYEIKHFGNYKVSDELNPKIIRDYTMPANCKFDENGIQVSHTPDSINLIFYVLEQDEILKNKKITKINPKYFKEWTETIEPETIKKMEKIFDKYLDECAKIGVEKALKKCVKSINKLDDTREFIGTIEMEDIISKIFEITKTHQVDEHIIEKVIEENRTW